jgi:hypothetical protein
MDDPASRHTCGKLGDCRFDSLPSEPALAKVLRNRISNQKKTAVRSPAQR